MLPNAYDKKLAHVVEILRRARGIKQEVLAKALGISPGEYSKRANGTRAFTCSQLRSIGEEIQVSHLHILAISDACFDPNLSITPLSKALSALVSDLEDSTVWFSWTEERIRAALRNLVSGS